MRKKQGEREREYEREKDKTEKKRMNGKIKVIKEEQIECRRDMQQIGAKKDRE